MKPWPTKKLGEICEENKKSPYKVEDADNSGDFPFFTSGEVVLTHSNYLVDGENIFLATGGYAKVKHYKGKACYSADTWSLKVKHRILAKYVYYQILRRLNLIDEILFRGSGLRHLQKKEFLNLEIPLPPLPIQQKIVSVLDTIQSAIELQKKIVEKTKELKKSLMAELFKYGGPSFRKGRKLKKTEIGEVPENWKVVRLGDKNLFEIKGGKRLPKGHNFAENKTSYPYIRVIDFKNGSVDINNLKYLTADDYEILKNYFITKNDIYISIAGTIGLVGLIPSELDGAILTENAAKIQIKNIDLIDKRFLATFLSSDKGQYQIKSLTAKSTQPKLGLYRIKQIKIPLPPLPEQREIAEILQTIDQKIEIEQKKKELYEELFKTMLNKIMNQEIDVEKIKI